MIKPTHRLLSLLLCAVLVLLSACGSQGEIQSPPPSEPATSPSSEPAPLPSEEPSEAEEESPAPSASTGVTPLVLPKPAPAQYPGRADFTPPTEEDMSIYDTSAILTAWSTGDPSGLSEYDRAIYDAAKELLDQLLTEDMSAYEKEIEIFRWIAMNVNYDWTHKDVMVTTPRESYTPYGGLVNHIAVCLGFATTFQLLMDLAGVECLTVVGACRDTESHAWNMVRLDGKWCCIDVGWDANYREDGYFSVTDGQESWRYLNVDSDYMAATNHQWDYNHVPEAVRSRNDQGVDGSQEGPSATPVQYPDRVDFIPPNTDDMTVYDTTAILDAWKAGGPTGLSEYDRAIYDAAADALSQIPLEEGMNEYEKERAIYGWIVRNINHDWTQRDIIAETPRDSYTPYGALVDRKAVSLGYATTLQLLMNMAGLECTTVVGASNSCSEDYAWNMIFWEGIWTCADVAMDAEYRERKVGDWADGGDGGCYYLGLTSNYLSSCDRQWDYANVPEAEYGWNGEEWVLPWDQ